MSWHSTRFCAKMDSLSKMKSSHGYYVIPLGKSLFPPGLLFGMWFLRTYFVGTYLLEIQSFLSCEHTLLLALDNIEDMTSLVYAYICTSFANLYERTGRSVKAVPNAREALAIWDSKTKNENDLANGFSDVGYSSIAAYEAEEDLKHLEKALAIAEAVQEPERDKAFNIDRYLRNHGRGNMLLGRYAEARADFDKAEYYQRKIHGENSHYDGE